MRMDAMSDDKQNSGSPSQVDLFAERMSKINFREY